MINTSQSSIPANYTVFPEYYEVPYIWDRFERYVPGAHEVERAIQIFEKLLPKNKQLKRLSDYRVQLFGFKNQGGEKCIWANFFSLAADMDWKRELVDIDEGGNRFFNVNVNLKTGEVYGLMVNEESLVN